MTQESSPVRKYILIGIGGIAFLFLVTWGLARLIAGLFPDDSPKQQTVLSYSKKSPNRVTLPRKYKYIKIQLPQKGKKAAPRERPWVGRKPNLPSHAELMRRVRAMRTYRSDLPKMPKPGSDHYRIKRSAFKEWLSKPLSESGATWRPHFIGGRPSGMRVKDIEPGSFLSRLGLNKNDILLTVNGREIVAPSHARKYYKQIAKRSRNLTLTFKRGGKTITADFDLK